ncbi:MAG: hypothetical protein HC895_19560 [Leptolyngbyaceae cyanobacterium SM1_3_5]|nr:hypothetical protein [Leptolyngbyaceae cyanobacterium SM1_3_5]
MVTSIVSVLTQIPVRKDIAMTGEVTLRGNVLAIDRPAYTLYAHPLMFQSARRAVAEQLAPILDRSAEALTDQMLNGDSGIELAYALSEEMADRVKDLGIDGLELVQHPQRLYPQEDLFATVVGYVNVDREGKAGLEMGQQKQLERPIETIRLRRSGNGTLMPISPDENADAPHDLIHQDDLRLQLTLDARLQRAARFALQQKVTEFKAKRGAALAIDVKTGALKAMVSVPSFDPNEYYKFDLERFRNWTVSNPYEPGSTFKPINVAIALEAGAFDRTKSSTTKAKFSWMAGLCRTMTTSRQADGDRSASQRLSNIPATLAWFTSCSGCSDRPTTSG